MKSLLVCGALLAAAALTAFAAKREQQPAVTQYTYEVLASYPHDGDAFTQGLECVPDTACSVLFESTGLYGKSSVRRVETATGSVLSSLALPSGHFGEGMTLHNGSLYQTTWKEHTIARYDPTTLALVASAPYTVTGEGWGLASTGTGQPLVASDGSSTLFFFTVDEATLAQQLVRTVDVTLGGKRVQRINELEYARGRVWANVWYSDTVLEIDPATGAVVGVLDLHGLHSPLKSGAGAGDVLNGIAYDAAADEFLVTGKNWHALHRIKVFGTQRRSEL